MATAEVRVGQVAYEYRVSPSHSGIAITFRIQGSSYSWDMVKAMLFIGGDTCPNRPEMAYIDLVPTCIDSSFAFFLPEQFHICLARSPLYLIY